MSLASRLGGGSSSSTAPVDIPSYANALAGAVASQDGSNLADLLSLRNSRLAGKLYSSLPASTVQSLVNNDAPHFSDFVVALRSFDYRYAASAASSPWPGIASKRIAVVIATHRTMDESGLDGDGWEQSSPAWDRAYAAQLEAVKSFLTWFPESSQGSTAWALPVLYTLCRDLKTLAVEADRELVKAREKATKLEEASRHITKGWTACLNDRGTPAGQPKRNRGTYYMATLLFKIYFKLETLSLCKNIVRGIQNTADLPPLSTFPMAHQVTYRYYLGVFDFLNERYDPAEAHLVFAFEHCHRSAYRNQSRILSYLIPMRLAKGILPSRQLLNNFPSLAALYGPFVDAYRIGDLKRYDDALLDNRGELVRRGSFLVIERAREGCLRMLFKKVWLCSGKGSRLLVETVQKALSHVNVDIDSDEVECLLANLIFKGHLKGYISHERQTVVLAKEKPFPPLIGRILQQQ